MLRLSRIAAVATLVLGAALSTVAATPAQAIPPPPQAKQYISSQAPQSLSNFTDYQKLLHRVSIGPGATGSWSKAVTVQNSFSVETGVNVPVAEISAKVGFNVTRSTTETVTCNFNTPGVWYVYPTFDVKQIKILKQVGAVKNESRDPVVGYIKTYRYVGVDYFRG